MRSNEDNPTPQPYDDSLVKCASCGDMFDKTAGEIEWTEDPYASEIHHDHTEMWLCKSCYNESSMDI